MSNQWIIVPNWDRFQHYKDRVPNWIKLYTAELDRDPDWEAMSAGCRGALVTIWIQYALSKGQLRCEVVSKSLGRSYKVAYLESLNDAGFIELAASKPVGLTRSRERSTEREKNLDALAHEPTDEARASAEENSQPVERDPEAVERIKAIGAKIGRQLP